MSAAFIIEMSLQSNVLDNVNAEIKSFRYRESLYGSSIYSLHIVSTDFEKYTPLVTKDNVGLRLRWSYIGDDGQRVYDKWKSVEVGEAQFKYSVAGFEVIVHGMDRGIVLGGVCHANAFVDLRISEMVVKLAEQNGLKHRIKQTFDTYSLYQCNLTDGQFIKDVLLPLAVDTSGNGGYNFFIADGNTLVFEPPSLTLTTKHPPFSFPDDIQVLDIKYHNYLEILGIGSLELRGFDIAQKVPRTTIANDNTVAFRKLAPNSPSAPELPSHIALTTRPSIGRLTNSAVKNEATALWSRHARSLFRTQLEVTPLIGVQVGETIMLEAREPSGKIFFPHGIWLVYSILQHRSETGKPTTTLYLERRTWD